MLARVRDLLLAAHLPLADRRDDLQLRRERRDRAVDSNLVVSLTRAAVGDRVATGGARDLDGDLGDQRAAERREERVVESIDRIRLDRGSDEVARELFARIDQLSIDGPKLKGLALDDLVILAGLAQIDRE